MKSDATEGPRSGASLTNGRPPLRPRSYVTPPPDPAEALYYEGMAAYQHRNWEEALARFGRLKELQPTRPGLDALLDEVQWFLQLQAAAPVATPEPTAHGSEARRSWGSADPESPARPALRSRWQTWVLLLLGLIGIVAMVLVALQGRLPWTNAADREALELYNRGQARLQVGDYEGAYAAFQKLLEIAPNDPEGMLGLSRAERQQTLAQGYAAAEAAIAQEDWDTAVEELRKVLAIDSSYADAQAKADFVTQRRRLADLYADGSRLYDLGQWTEAISQFERIRELDASYRPEAVAEFLFVCYLNAGQLLIEGADGNVAQVQRATEYFSRALAIHPRNRAATDARRLSSLYLDATRALASADAGEAQSRLEVLLGEAPSYANGQAAKQLYALLLKRAEATLQGGDSRVAVRLYQQAQGVAVADHTAAIEGEAVARAATPIPSPAPTSTPLPTDAPPTATPLPPSPPSGTSPAPAETAQPTASVGQMVCLVGQVRDASGSKPLTGWAVALTQPNGSIRTHVTDSSGFFRFADLEAGAHVISERVEPGWRAISPQSSRVTLVASTACMEFDFWNERTDIGGAQTPATSPPTATPEPPPSPTPPR